MSGDGKIDVSDADLIKLVQRAYDLSAPVGLGHLHYEPGSLSAEDASTFIYEKGFAAVSADYINGRCVKLLVYRLADEPGKLWMWDSWQDHTAEQLKELLAHAGVPDPAVVEYEGQRLL